MSGLLNPIKMNHSNSFILPGGEYSGTFNKNNEKVGMLQFDLETTKDTIIKLRSEIMNKNKEINDLKINKVGKNNEHLYTLKVIETVLKILGEDSSKDSNNEANNENNNNSNSNNVNGNENENENENKKEPKEEDEKENKHSSTNKLPPISNHMEQSPKKSNKTNREVPYISSLKQQINTLKELLNKKNEEIKEMQKNKTTINYSKLQNNFEKNFTELTNIKKQNELMKTKIEDVSNLLFIEKEGNKSLKSKLQVFQSSFKEFQENSDKKNTDLESKLVQAQERERECRIFHVRRTVASEHLGSRSSSKININELDDTERLKIAEEEIQNIKKDIESTNRDINNKNNENESLKTSKMELETKVNDLKDRNSKLKNEINNLNKNIIDLKNTKKNLEKDNKEIKNKYNNSNNNLTNEKNKIVKIKENLNKKENEIIELKKQIEQLKQNNNFKDGMFYTSIGAKGTTNNNNLEDLDVNIDEEMAQIEKKYKMINEQNKLLEDKIKTEEVKNENKEDEKENINKDNVNENNDKKEE